MATLDTSSWPSYPAHLTGVVTHYPSVFAAAGRRGVPQKHPTAQQAFNSVYQRWEGVEAYPRHNKPPRMGGGR